jgi:inactivated superfamily I helicase
VKRVAVDARAVRRGDVRIVLPPPSRRDKQWERYRFRLMKHQPDVFEYRQSR